MNERIKLLAEQAGLQTELWMRSRNNPEPYLIYKEDVHNPGGLTKFAQLIVGECVQTLRDNTPERLTNESAEEDWDKGYDRAMRDCVDIINEHFGVLE